MTVQGSVSASFADFAADESADDTNHPLDLVHLARQTMGDRALEVELLAMFDRQAGQIAQRLSEPCGEAQRHWQADMAHMLKGSARAIGAFAVAAAADNYEAKARSARLTDRDQARLVEAVAQVRAAMRQLAA